MVTRTLIAMVLLSATGCAGHLSAKFGRVDVTAADSAIVAGPDDGTYQLHLRDRQRSVAATYRAFDIIMASPDGRVLIRETCGEADCWYDVIDQSGVRDRRLRSEWRPVGGFSPDGRLLQIYDHDRGRALAWLNVETLEQVEVPEGVEPVIANPGRASRQTCEANGKRLGLIIRRDDVEIVNEKGERRTLMSWWWRIPSIWGGRWYRPRLVATFTSDCRSVVVEREVRLFVADVETGTVEQLAEGVLLVGIVPSAVKRP